MSDLVKENTSGQGAINATWVCPVGKTYQLISVSLKLDVAASTSEDFVITLDAAGGSDYDVTYLSEDLGVSGAVTLVWLPDAPVYLAGGDAVDVAWANTDARKWGLEYTTLRVRQQ